MSNVCPNCGPHSLLSRSSPFHAHLGKCIAFDTPTPERRAILDSMHDIEQDIASYRERIAHLTAALADAQSQLDSLEEVRIAHNKLFPPVHTLPVEVLLRIFQLVVKKPYHLSSIKDGPWCLGHVCRLWRQITSAPSSLWSFPSCRPSSVRICTNMLATVLERALPLTLNFDMHSTGESRDIVQSHSLRW
ncbi:hypothetical protein BDZ89DRAFT_89480 [Hymenopellis radicata]|nr:hypothetical protein BDZ89DRAFT_89480 [Hymenopellis radicata]